MAVHCEVVMETSVGTSVEIRVLGPLAVLRDGEPVALPRSRKVRALLGYLALARAPVARSKLCDLFWDVANDPRGELRWCLSKLRGVLGDDCIQATEDVVGLANCTIDAMAAEPEFRGDLLDGLHLDATAELAGWLLGQRQHFRTLHIRQLEERAKRSSPEEMIARLEQWLALAPFDTRAHEAMLQALVQRGRIREANEHLAAAIRAFEQEGIDWLPLRESWRTARAPKVEAVASSEAPRQRRASVAVMPFEGDAIAAGLTDDVITRLAKLRVMFVIARGTVYALAERKIDPQEAGRILDVEYVVSGRVRRAGDRVSVVLELAETQNARIVWTDELECKTDAAFGVLDETCDRIVSAVAEGIEAAEIQRSVLKPPSSLDAWEAYHRGLWHMYKFKAEDNRAAEQFFRSSLALDPTFARAYAGLSFTHFQNAFLGLTNDRSAEIAGAYDAAVRSVGADDRDPAAHWAMGRALWLRGAQNEAVSELQRSVDLSPNFALGHYTLGFVHAQSGDPQAAIDATDQSRKLSPFDPLQFAMLATRGLALMRLGRHDEAADWAVKATARPNAHEHILAIATTCLALADRADEARGFIARIRSRAPSYNVDHFMRSFHFEPAMERAIRKIAREAGFE
jgi:DNA-binding SARP family transcriptional activator